jgi:hypothetical protein
MTLTLPTQRTKPITDLGKQTILLYSAPKLGKSQFASNFPEAIFFECEPGLNHLEVFKVPTYTWEDFLAACKLVAQGNHPFKTIVVDTADNAFKFCSEYVCSKHNIEYEGDMGHGKGWRSGKRRVRPGQPVRVRAAVYAERPFMGPALEAEKDHIPDAWSGSVGG